jgi:hypothetical protein
MQKLRVWRSLGDGTRDGVSQGSSSSKSLNFRRGAEW